MAVDLVFRGGPLTLTPTVGSVGSGTVQLSFRSFVSMRSVFIPATTRISFLDGRFELRVAPSSTQLIPSGKGWASLPSQGQLFPRRKNVND